MKIIKKTVYIASVILAVGIILTACSKESASEGSQKKFAKTNDIFVNRQNSLTASRNGQFATLKWQADTKSTKIKQIIIQRSSTGTQNWFTVAELGPQATGFQDCLPDHYAYWYHVRFFTEDKYQDIGPIRVEPDKAGSANYIKQNAKFIATVTRTDYSATIKWNFPDDKYRVIKIYRYSHLRAAPSTVAANLVASSMEWKSELTNALPDANLDYWYWIQIVLESGTIIYKGPIKAEYASQ